MKVTDKITGNILESENDIVVGSWKNSPDRFVEKIGGNNVENTNTEPPAELADKSRQIKDLSDLSQVSAKQVKPRKKAGD